MPLDMGSMNPQQIMFLMQMLRGGQQQGGMPGMPGMPGMGQQGGGLTPQQALMQQIQNPPPSPMQQIMQQLQQLQQLQGQRGTGQPGQPNPLMGQGMQPDVLRALLMRGQQGQPGTPGMGMPGMGSMTGPGGMQNTTQPPGYGG